MCKIFQGAPDLLYHEQLGCSLAVLVGMLQGHAHTAWGSASRPLHYMKLSAHVSDPNNKTPGSSLHLAFIVGDTPCQQPMGVDHMTLATHPGQ